MGVLEGKVIVITGSTRGFGLAMAKSFASEGAQVVLSSRSQMAVDRAVAQLMEISPPASPTAGGLACDVSDFVQVTALADYALANYGRFDVWVNNAGISPPYGPTIHVDPGEFAKTVQTNILGTYYGSLVAMRHFLERGSGKLINILGYGSTQPSPMQNAYGSSKAWVVRFTESLAKEYKDSGVGVYALNPGMMDTDLLLNVDVVAGYEHSLDRFETVLRILSQPPEKSAPKAVWLASSATDGRTGMSVKEMSMVKILGNVLRLSLDNLLHRPKRPIDIHITSVPPAYPLKKKEEVAKV